MGEPRDPYGRTGKRAPKSPLWRAREDARTTTPLVAGADEDASPHQRILDRLTAKIGWPGVVARLAVTGLAWALAYAFPASFGVEGPDPPPCNGVQVVAKMDAMLASVLILTTRRGGGTGVQITPPT